MTHYMYSYDIHINVVHLYLNVCIYLLTKVFTYTPIEKYVKVRGDRRKRGSRH